jgi:hypothetical protein
MATSAELVDRVRSNINEPFSNDDPQRTDQEIAQWLTDGLYDYVQKIPADGAPELVVHSTFTGDYWEIPADYMRLLHVVVSHTIGGIQVVTEQAYVLNVDEVYLCQWYPGGLGAWARFDRIGSTHVIRSGPNVFSGTITYIGLPNSLATCNVTFPMGAEHEEPIVNYATAMALAKINDEDAPRYLERYNERIMAENGRYPQPKKVEKERPTTGGQPE